MLDLSPSRRSPHSAVDSSADQIHEAWHRACDRRDPAFDGVFFVAITSTRVYCRPVCPSRRARPERRRFFLSAAAAEEAGFRPCLRCRPEGAPGEAPVDAVARLARAAALRIADGALDGHNVKTLASELGVSERQLRRSVERELGVAPRALAEAERLHRARELLVATKVPVSRVAYASGFQSLRRFNAAFRQVYAMSPSEMRRSMTAE